MGNDCSKGSDKHKPNILTASKKGLISAKMAPKSYVGFGDGSDIRVESVQRDDQMQINIIKREFGESLDKFLLNNVIMGVQFFSDHKEVIKRLQNICASPQEKEMNKTLLKHEIMECTYPDAIMEEVNKNIIFRPMGEYSKSENLVARRIYVTNDLIEVVKSDEIPQYTSIDKPCYQVKVEECKRKGFLKLRQIENNSPILKTREYDENYEPLPGPSTRSDPDYDYTTITDLRTPKPIDVDDSIERRDTLPKTCFTQKKIKHFPSKSSDDGEAAEISMEDLENFNEEDFFMKVIFINSQGFMKYFQNSLFPVSLGKSLGFSEFAIEVAKTIPGKIFCDEFDEETSVTKKYEVIPAVSIPWPDEQTFEFVCREDRPTIIDTRTGMKYIWPTTGPGGMMDEIRNMTAVLVPKGYAKKKGVNNDANLEWEINFPKAERYLEARMSHAQMKCMLLLLALHKTFIAPETGQNGLLPEHIRTHMYWQCERDYRNWPEHRLGTKILRVIEDLKQALYLGSLPDYFIKERNLFENIPKKYLNIAQKVCLDILSNPVPFFIKALRNLRYSSGKFYPPFNFKELYDELRSETSAGSLNPNLVRQTIPQLKRRQYRDPDQQLKHLKYLKQKQQILRERRKEEEQKAAEREGMMLSNDEEDGIDLENPIDKEMDLMKTKVILMIFINHFIDISKRSVSLATLHQARFYLKQAFYLTHILEDSSASFLDELKELRQVIAREEARIKRKSVNRTSHSFSEEKPPTPQRNSITFQYNDINQQLKTGSIRLNNLQSSYLNGMEPAPQVKNVKPATVQKSESNKQKEVPPKRKTVAFIE